LNANGPKFKVSLNVFDPWDGTERLIENASQYFEGTWKDDGVSYIAVIDFTSTAIPKAACPFLIPADKSAFCHE
jgi:hypothetical protein